MSETLHPVVDLGCANGWREMPAVYLAHDKGHKPDARHDVTTRSLGRCWTEYTCNTCGIRWNVDSSD